MAEKEQAQKPEEGVQAPESGADEGKTGAKAERHPLLSRPVLPLYVLAGVVLAGQALPAGKVIIRKEGKPWLTTDNLRLLSPKPEPAESASPESKPPVVNAPIAKEGEVELGFATKEAGELKAPSLGGGRPGDLFGGKKASKVSANPAKGSPVPIEDPSGKALDAYYESLWQVEQKKPGAIARFSYYGDSIIATDWITATLRRRLQTRFGDGGHGFVLVANAWRGYSHKGLYRFASKGWKVSRVVGPWAKDGLYGLGGVSFLAQGPGMFAKVGTTDKGKLGRTVSRFHLSYAKVKGGGKLKLTLDGKDPKTIDTSADKAEPTGITLKVPVGAHRLEIRSMGGGPVRVFGVELENDGPGAVVDSIGIIGCRLRFLDKIDDEHWATELKRRNPSLIAFAYGANESGDGFAYPMDKYEKTARAVYKQAKAALPNSSCLMIGPMDGARKKGGAMVSKPVIAAMNDIQKKLAKELGCGYFNTFKAMGGTGSMATWVGRGLGAKDLTHPTDAGAEVLGTWLYSALMSGYDSYKQAKHPQLLLLRVMKQNEVAGGFRERPWAKPPVFEALGLFARHVT